MTAKWNVQHDYHSSANTDALCVHHLDLNLVVDFDLQQLIGVARLQFTRTISAVSLVLDCRDLLIQAITDSHANPLSYTMSDVSDILGQKLVIDIGEQVDEVVIDYRTSTNAQGLQWLTPQQTLGKKLPYLFSQSQPINARSWIPLQDTPKARITFNATINVPQGLRAVMSAENIPDMPDDGVFTFCMNKPIPTHLLAIAVGELSFQATGPRSGIYTEPGMLAAAVKEFEDTESMIQIAESILGPYAWGRFDMIILPPSFPFGGMENPMLAFMTPTLIAGDKSLVSTVAHELAHSWTGNLVSNATWRDLWLNEGFTTYFTNRIVEAVYGEEQAELEWVIEYGRLQEEMGSTPLVSQTLPANVQDRDPNLAFNRFTYDKASMFVHELESRLGRAAFDKFLFQYVDYFSFSAITTETFIDYAKQTLLVEHHDKLTLSELNEWVYGQGLPQWFIGPTSSSLDKVELAVEAVIKGTPAIELQVDGWRVHHWQYFLTQLPLVVSQAVLLDLDATFTLTNSLNAEIACDWYRVAIRNHFDPVLPALSGYLCRIGRGKFVRPLFVELQIAGYQQELLDIYAKARPGYHPSLQVQLDKLLII
ncbi:M1 family peptidase [Shewanella vesiculosa]|uniref:M1 family metallopeptidase n=1 Tax=Shewanella vesiculosa TaxID=518738 RepID=UPI000F512264|nr:M1 family metallopeptidase [Shewanella vesiculosa]RPA38683.1 M1 family peptidase [Shewanella vesiculosa]UJL42985.1 M1 family metallopeptidase [Shewanella vesiculosa]